MRLLSDEQVARIKRETGIVWAQASSPKPDFHFAIDKAICQAQAELTESDTLKEVGDEMMKMSTLQEFHALRVRLIQGKLDV